MVTATRLGESERQILQRSYGHLSDSEMKWRLFVDADLFHRVVGGAILPADPG